MKLRRLGRSGIELSPMGLGTARIAGMGWHDEIAPRVTQQVINEAIQQIQASVDSGVTLFDTADSYGQGLSERILGEALRDRYEGIVVVTKFGEEPCPNHEDPWSLDSITVTQAREGSLRRLGVECLDVYLLHRRDYPLESAPGDDPGDKTWRPGGYLRGQPQCTHGSAPHRRSQPPGNRTA